MRVRTKVIIGFFVALGIVGSCTGSDKNDKNSPTTTTTANQVQTTETNPTNISFDVPVGLPGMTCEQLMKVHRQTAQKLSDYITEVGSYKAVQSDPMVKEGRQVLTVINAYDSSCKWEGSK